MTKNKVGLNFFAPLPTHTHAHTILIIPGPYIQSVVSPCSEALLTNKYRRWMSWGVNHLGVLMSQPTDRHDKLPVPQCLAPLLPP